MARCPATSFVSPDPPTALFRCCRPRHERRLLADDAVGHAHAVVVAAARVQAARCCAGLLGREARVGERCMHGCLLRAACSQPAHSVPLRREARTGWSAAQRRSAACDVPSLNALATPPNTPHATHNTAAWSMHHAVNGHRRASSCNSATFCDSVVCYTERGC